MRKPIYLYRIEWADILPDRRVKRQPIIGGGMHDAKEARNFARTAFSSPAYRKAKVIRGEAVVTRVRRIGPDTPAMREKVALL